MAYEYEHEEWRSALRGMTEAQRVVNCGHTGRQGGENCPDCGEPPETADV
jgi:hypothetical protein